MVATDASSRPRAPARRAHRLPLALDLIRDPFEGLARLARERGDIAETGIGRRRAVLVSHPEAIREALGQRASVLTKGDSLGGLRVLLGEGMISADGEEHAAQRRLARPFFAPASRATWASAIAEAAAESAACWTDGAVRDVQADMLRVSLVATARALLGSDLDDVDAVAGALGTLDEISYLTSLPGLAIAIRSPLPVFVRFRSARDILRASVEGLIGRRLTTSSPSDDLLTAILRDTGWTASAPAIDRVLTILVAGSVTTGHALAWALYCLAGATDAQEAIAAEARAVLGRHAPAGDDVRALRLGRAAFAESMRLYPPAWLVTRTATAETELAGRRVRRGTFVLVSPWVTHRDPRWHRAPELFEPSRWLNGQPTPAAFIPFGAGPRRCIGEPLAWLEGTVVLAVLLSRWELSRVTDRPPSFRRAITLGARHGLPIVVRQRPGATPSSP